MRGREVTLLIEQPRARPDCGATLAHLGRTAAPRWCVCRCGSTTPGPQRLSVRVAPQPGEQLSENNRREVLLDVYDRSERLLYVEGEPRFELKFIRRAGGGRP